mgnify:FL=1
MYTILCTSNAKETKSFENVEKIEIDFTSGGSWGTGFKYTVNGSEKGWDWIEGSSTESLREIILDSPSTITKIKFTDCQYWYDGSLVINAIRFHLQNGNIFSLTPEKTNIALNEKIKLTPSGHGTIDDVNDWTVSPAGAATITNENGEWYLTAGSTEGEATDADGKTGTATINIKPMEIMGPDSVGVGSSITLEGMYVPSQYYEWSSEKPEIATVGQDGVVTANDSATGSTKIYLKAYRDEAKQELIATDEKSIVVNRIYTMAISTDKIINRVDGNNRCSVSLKNIPSNAKIKSITVNLSTANSIKITQAAFILTQKEGEDYKNESLTCEFSQTGSISLDVSSISDNILTGTDDSLFTFGIWWSDGNNPIDVTVTSVIFEYETDGRLLTMKYDDNSESKTIRNKKTANFTVTATGGTLGDVVLKNGETIIEGAITGDNGNYTVTPPAAGSYKITATMDDITKSIALTVKDNITVNGDYKMDFNSSQTLDVNNKIRTITWTPVGEINTDYTVDGNIVTFQNADKEIAVFNTSTGDVTVFEESGSFTVKATDSYDNTFTEFEISISERPKVPVLPKYDESFKKKVEVVLKDGEWIGIADKLPLTDEKGNPYYYYIQESGYRLTENGETSVMNDTIGHYIHSNGSVWMPINYYNNGLFPAQNGETVPIAKVENKLTETIQGQLPSTGGSGVKTYYYFGGAIMLLGIAGFTGIKRRERKRRKE